MKIIVIVQVRMSSNRFPGKVLYQVAGKPLIQYVIESLGQCHSLDGIVVATSSEVSDDPVADYCRRLNLRCFRGELKDVAKRFSCAMETFKMDACVRICGDSPLLDYRIVDKAVRLYRSGGYDIVTNVLKRTYPKGLSVEVVNSKVFRSAYPLMKSENHREHVTSYFYDNSSQFNIFNFESGGEYGNIQCSVDTVQDMARFEKIIDKMDKFHWEYDLKELLRLNQELS